jgi:deazaflavin-dependent oxidoreductase (nitroreductase family)
VIVASKGGAPEHPGWYENLLADPHATIEVLGEEIPVVASTASGDERARLWSLMAEVWPAYDDYASKTRCRADTALTRRGGRWLRGSRARRADLARAARRATRDTRSPRALLSGSGPRSRTGRARGCPRRAPRAQRRAR